MRYWVIGLIHEETKTHSTTLLSLEKAAETKIGSSKEN